MGSLKNFQEVLHVVTSKHFYTITTRKMNTSGRHLNKEKEKKGEERNKTNTTNSPELLNNNRPTRNRRAPRRFNLLQALLLMLCIGLVIEDSTIKDGIYFKKDREVIYSNSEWIITTEVSFGHLVTNLRSLRNHLTSRAWNAKILTPSLDQGKPYKMQARLITYAQQAANDCLMTLDVLEDRLQKIINSTIISIMVGYNHTMINSVSSKFRVGCHHTNPR